MGYLSEWVDAFQLGEIIKEVQKPQKDFKSDDTPEMVISEPIQVDYSEVKEYKPKNQGLNELYLNIIPDAIPESGSKDWDNLDQWGWQVVTTYNPKSDVYLDWTEDKSEELHHYLGSADIIISYNWDGFDSKILSMYGSVKHLSAFSFMHQVMELTGIRLKLQNLANHNGFYGIRKDLAKFLNEMPTLNQCRAFNRNKINSLNFLIDKAINDGYLNYYSVGDERKLSKINTTTWLDKLKSWSIPF